MQPNRKQSPSPPPPPPPQQKLLIKLRVSDLSKPRAPDPPRKSTEADVDELLDDDPLPPASATPAPAPASTSKRRGGGTGTRGKRRKVEPGTPTSDGDVSISWDTASASGAGTPTKRGRGKGSRGGGTGRGRGGRKSGLQREVLAIPGTPDSLGELSLGRAGSPSSTSTSLAPTPTPILTPVITPDAPSVPPAEIDPALLATAPRRPLPTRAFPVQPAPKAINAVPAITSAPDWSRRKTRKWSVQWREVRGVGGGSWWVRSWVGSTESEYASDPARILSVPSALPRPGKLRKVDSALRLGALGTSSPLTPGSAAATPGPSGLSTVTSALGTLPALPALVPGTFVTPGLLTPPVPAPLPSIPKKEPGLAMGQFKPEGEVSGHYRERDGYYKEKDGQSYYREKDERGYSKEKDGQGHYKERDYKEPAPRVVLAHIESGAVEPAAVRETSTPLRDAPTPVRDAPPPTRERYSPPPLREPSVGSRAASISSSLRDRDTPTLRDPPVLPPLREPGPRDTPTSSLRDAPIREVPTPSIRDAPTSSMRDAPASSVRDAPTSSIRDTPTSSLRDTPSASLRDPNAPIPISSLRDSPRDPLPPLHRERDPIPSRQGWSGSISVEGHNRDRERDYDRDDYRDRKREYRQVDPRYPEADYPSGRQHDESFTRYREAEPPVSRYREREYPDREDRYRSEERYRDRERERDVVESSERYSRVRSEDVDPPRRDYRDRDRERETYHRDRPSREDYYRDRDREQEIEAEPKPRLAMEPNGQLTIETRPRDETWKGKGRAVENGLGHEESNGRVRSGSGYEQAAKDVEMELMGE